MKSSNILLYLSVFSFGLTTSFLIRDSLFLGSYKKERMCITDYYSDIRSHKELVPNDLKRYVIGRDIDNK
jgi:hypothetical protein